MTKEQVDELTRVDGIVKFLEAYSFMDVRSALKEVSLRRRGVAKTMNEHYKWIKWTADEPPPKGYEWRRINGVLQIRPPVPFPTKPLKRKAEAKPTPKAGPRPKVEEGVKKIKCPLCGDLSFKQSVCPKCLKGKAGIKSQWTCGECNFTFFTD